MRQTEMFQFIIDGELPNLNAYIDAERTNKYIAAKMKKDATNKVVTFIKREKNRPHLNNIELIIRYYCKNKRIDKDNIAFVKKFILDGLEKSGIIPSDGWKNIDGWIELFMIDKQNPRIEITIFEIEEEK